MNRPAYASRSSLSPSSPLSRRPVTRVTPAAAHGHFRRCPCFASAALASDTYFFTVDGLLWDDSEMLTQCAHKAALHLFPQTQLGQSFGPWPFFKRTRQILPALQSLSELPLFIRVLADEGLVPTVVSAPEDGEVVLSRRRTRALNPSQINDPENAEYLLDVLTIRWGVPMEDLAAAFRAARREVVLGGSGGSGGAGGAGDAAAAARQPAGVRPFLVNAVNALSARGSTVVLLSSDEQAVAEGLLRSAGIDVDGADGARRPIIRTATTELQALAEHLEKQAGSDRAAPRSGAAAQGPAGPSQPGPGATLLSDRLRFLEAARSTSLRYGVRAQPCLASWGYNTASLRARALSNGWAVVDELSACRLMGLENSAAVMDGRPM